LPGGEKLILVLIPPGEFLMGSDDAERARLLEEASAAGKQWVMNRIASESPQHVVRITRPFWLGRHEVTLGQFRQFAEHAEYKTEAEQDGNGGYGLVNGQWVQDPRFVWNGDLGFPRTENDPVVHVSWNDAISFCQWLSKRDGAIEFGLPTEAQWEFACRAGTTTPWYEGESNAQLAEYGWFDANSVAQLHPVGQLRPNAFGLYDMHGNVWEWCRDWYAADYYGHSPRDNPTGLPNGLGRVQRGGDWVYGRECCRSAYRQFGATSDRSISLGFRLAATWAEE
jgi:formylglycine-generating enzyme required for sulfatase activity